MAKIGSYYYPYLSIDDAIDIIELIDEKDIREKERLSTLLHHSSPESGTFKEKIIALRRYGLVSDSEELSLTDLARTILQKGSDSEEGRRCIQKALYNIDLLRELYQTKTQENSEDRDFNQLISQITDVDPEDVERKVRKVENCYKEGLKYVRDSDRTKTKKQTNKGSRDEKMSEEFDPGLEDGYSEGLAQESSEETVYAKLITPRATIEVVDRATLKAVEALVEDMRDKIDSEK